MSEQLEKEPLLVQDARGLSSGTLAGLVGDNRYTVLDAVQLDFIEFCQENPRYKNWVEAWNEFKAIYNFAEAISNGGGNR